MGVIETVYSIVHTKIDNEQRFIVRKNHDLPSSIASFVDRRQSERPSPTTIATFVREQGSERTVTAFGPHLLHSGARRGRGGCDVPPATTDLIDNRSKPHDVFLHIFPVPHPRNRSANITKLQCEVHRDPQGGISVGRPIILPRGTPGLSRGISSVFGMASDVFRVGGLRGVGPLHCTQYRCFALLLF